MYCILKSDSQNVFRENVFSVLLSALHARVPVVAKMLRRLEPAVGLAKAADVKWLLAKLLVGEEARLWLVALTKVIAVKVHLIRLEPVLAHHWLEPTSNLVGAEVDRLAFLVVEDLGLRYAFLLDYLQLLAP